MSKPTFILTDIEGTTTSVSFVYDVLFPYFRENMQKVLTMLHLPEVQAIFQETIRLAQETENKIIASDEEFYEESIDKDVSVFDIDIPYNIYEIHNSEYDWSKIENVTFVENNVVIEKNSYRLSDIRYD